MTHETLPPEAAAEDTLQEDAFQQYAADLEPLIADKATHVRPTVEDRVLLGRLSDLAPDRPRNALQLSEADQLWLKALESVAHRHGVSCELITQQDGEDRLYLVPLH